MTEGIVYLVGAGPGDPGCLTLRGRECLSVADVVVYDYLANADLLRFAPALAEKIFAGKHGAGARLLEQSEINRLLVERARAGSKVVRLKGGDPMLFGRGGEEAETLAEAGVAYEVVPGVSSALAVPAYAGIPVTHRDWVSGVTILTGHEAPDRETQRVRWSQVATAGNTIVLLMGLTQLRANLRALLDAGLDPAVPAAAIRWGSLPHQEVFLATAGTLATELEAARIRPPVTVVIGEVVRLRDRIEWFERRPLFGRRVLVTRTREQAGALAHRLSEAGAAVIECPTIEIAPPDDLAPLDAALERLEDYDWVIFTSVNGVEQLFRRLDARGGDVRRLHRARLAAIGPATAADLERRHLRVDRIAAEFRAEGIAAALADTEVAAARVLLPRAANARALLPEWLRSRGALVDEVESYQSVLPPEGRDLLTRALAEGPLDCVTFTSSSTVTNFFRLLDDVAPERGRRDLEHACIACIGPITADTARAAGLHVDVVPEQYTIGALADAIIARFGAHQQGGV